MPRFEPFPVLGEILDKLPPETTTVIIAHRLNTVNKVDQVYFVNSSGAALAGSREHAMDMLQHGKVPFLRSEFFRARYPALCGGICYMLGRLARFLSMHRTDNLLHPRAIVDSADAVTAEVDRRAPVPAAHGRERCIR
jgi:hypothetical protein